MTVGEILGWMVAGLVVGAIARLLVPGRQPMGIFMTMVLGILGAFAGGVIYNLVYHGTLTRADFDVATAWHGWIFSIIGGIVLLVLYIMVAGRRTS
jgi:uncharacterized membrane protein YeaQ/YmgE (transglycosylase-associated protein family)